MYHDFSPLSHYARLAERLRALTTILHFKRKQNSIQTSKPNPSTNPTSSLTEPLFNRRNKTYLRNKCPQQNIQRIQIPRRSRIHLPHGSQQNRALETPLLNLAFHLRDQRVEGEVALGLDG